jgi:phosphate-selective porin OprO/OprP
VPSRDVGVQVYGDVRGGVLRYEAGLFNGVPDLGVGETDAVDQKDVAARLFAIPFRNRGPKLLKDLGFGVAASRGTHIGSLTASALPAYRSPAQQSVFAYRSDGTAAGTVFADGALRRVSPQAYIYAGRFGLLSEYVRTSQHVRRASSLTNLNHDAWQVSGSVVLTGEKPSYRGLTPTKPFDRTARAWGAVELGARIGALELDRDAFPVYANPSTQVRAEREWALALNWYLAKGMRIAVDYERTRFTGGATTGNRESEHAILTRVQHSF